MENLTQIAQMSKNNKALLEIINAVQDLQDKVNNGEFTPVWCSPNRFYRLSKAVARRMPKVFKDELKINGDYQNHRYIVRLHKATLDNGKAEYRIYIKSRRLNIYGKQEEIGGSGATLEEASNAFIEALRAVKLPPQNRHGGGGNERRRIIQGSKSH